jgi:UDP-N-acetylglucosamine 2-epimerase (non-hydrolysing)
MLDMVEAVLTAADNASPRHEVRWPVHPNPAVQMVARQVAEHPALLREEPLPYPQFLRAIQDASLVITDSGGSVEESTVLGTPTLQLREYTDRQEAVAAQMSWLVGRNPQDVVKLVGEALTVAPPWKASLQGRASPYGDGTAGAQMADAIKTWMVTHG